MNWFKLAVGVAASLTLMLEMTAQPGFCANPPGPKGGAGHGKYWKYNPPGNKGGKGSGWTYNPPGPGKTYFPSRAQVNPPGPVGGVGAGKFWKYNPPGQTGGPGSGWVYNPPGPGKAYFPKHRHHRGAAVGSSVADSTTE